MRAPDADALEALLAKAAPAAALPSDYHHAAVLLPLSLVDGAYHLTLTRRSYQLEHDGGVICFPGGGREDGDATLADTALRETYEEIGVAPSDVRLLGSLEPYFTRSNFAIHPAVGLIPSAYPYRPSAAEVDEIIVTPLEALYDPANVRHERVLRDGVTLDRFTFAHEGRIIFGATAQMLARLLELIADGVNKEVPWRSETLGWMA